MTTAVPGGAVERACGEYRIEDLAGQSGATVRTIRAYQDRGLLPRPGRRGRVNVYDDTHLTRLRQIAALLERGYTLASIKELLEAWDEGRGLSGVLGLVSEVEGPWTDEEPERVTRAELDELFDGGAGDSDVAVAEAVELGVLVPLPERPGEYLLPSPQELAVAAELHRAGVPLLALTEHLRELRTQVEHIAARFMELTDEHIFRRCLHARPSDEDASEAAGLVRRLRPLAKQTVDAELARAMRAVASRSLREHLRRASGATPRGAMPPGAPEPGPGGAMPGGTSSGPSGPGLGGAMPGAPEPRPGATPPGAPEPGLGGAIPGGTPPGAPEPGPGGTLPSATPPGTPEPGPGATPPGATPPGAPEPGPGATVPSATPPGTPEPGPDGTMPGTPEPGPGATPPGAPEPGPGGAMPGGTSSGPSGPGPGRAAPETVIPETAVPEAVAPNTTAPNLAPPETTLPNTTAPNPTVPNTTVPDAAAGAPSEEPVRLPAATLAAVRQLVGAERAAAFIASAAEREVHARLMDSLAADGNLRPGPAPPSP